jgi:hypothetical protein
MGAVPHPPGLRLDGETSPAPANTPGKTLFTTKKEAAFRGGLWVKGRNDLRVT